MRLNGLGTSDEITLVPLNKIEASQPPIETKPVENRVQSNENDTASTVTNLATSKQKAKKRRETNGNKTETITDTPTLLQASH